MFERISRERGLQSQKQRDFRLFHKQQEYFDSLNKVYIHVENPLPELERKAILFPDRVRHLKKCTR
jgi:hypothetical protein